MSENWLFLPCLHLHLLLLGLFSHLPVLSKKAFITLFSQSVSWRRTITAGICYALHGLNALEMSWCVNTCTFVHVQCVLFWLYVHVCEKLLSVIQLCACLMGHLCFCLYYDNIPKLASACMCIHHGYTSGICLCVSNLNIIYMLQSDIYGNSIQMNPLSTFCSLLVKMNK